VVERKGVVPDRGKRKYIFPAAKHSKGKGQGQGERKAKRERVWLGHRNDNYGQNPDVGLFLSGKNRKNLGIPKQVERRTTRKKGVKKTNVHFRSQL